MEISGLRAELIRVKMERDFLGKATAYFAKAAKWSTHSPRIEALLSPCAASRPARQEVAKGTGQQIPDHPHLDAETARNLYEAHAATDVAGTCVEPSVPVLPRRANPGSLRRTKCREHTTQQLLPHTEPWPHL